jgi:hypothetical protein
VAALWSRVRHAHQCRPALYGHGAHGAPYLAGQSGFPRAYGRQGRVEKRSRTVSTASIAGPGLLRMDGGKPLLGKLAAAGWIVDRLAGNPDDLVFLADHLAQVDILDRIVCP